MAREDDGGGAAGAPALDNGFVMLNAQPSRVPSVLAARMTWVWANFVNAPPSGECRYRRAAEALLKCIQSAPSGATGPRRRIHTSPPIPRCETGKEGLKGEQTRRREMIILLGEWRNHQSSGLVYLLMLLRTHMYRITSENFVDFGLKLFVQMWRCAKRHISITSLF